MEGTYAARVCVCGDRWTSPQDETGVIHEALWQLLSASLQVTLTKTLKTHARILQESLFLLTKCER